VSGTFTSEDVVGPLLSAGGRLGMEPAERYERARPGELIHIDVKRPGASRAAPGTR
jgi:hypothetical protein